MTYINLFSTFFGKSPVFVWQFSKRGGEGYERGNKTISRFCGSKRRRYLE